MPRLLIMETWGLPKLCVFSKIEQREQNCVEEFPFFKFFFFVENQK